MFTLPRGDQFLALLNVDDLLTEIVVFVWVIANDGGVTQIEEDKGLCEVVY